MARNWPVYHVLRHQFVTAGLGRGYVCRGRAVDGRQRRTISDEGKSRLSVTRLSREYRSICHRYNGFGRYAVHYLFTSVSGPAQDLAQHVTNVLSCPSRLLLFAASNAGKPMSLISCLHPSHDHFKCSFVFAPHPALLPPSRPSTQPWSLSPNPPCLPPDRLA